MRVRGLAAAPAALALAAGLAAAGCDAQADRDYRGEPLVTLRGEVEGTPPLPPLEAAMLWQRGPPPSTDDQELATHRHEEVIVCGAVCHLATEHAHEEAQDTEEASQAHVE